MRISAFSVASSVTVVAALLLAGCVTARDTETGVNVSGRYAFLDYAGAKTPVYLTVVNTPVAEPQLMANRVAASATGRVFGSDVRFTADPSLAAVPQYRLVTVFDPSVSMSGDAACEADGNPPVAERYQDRTNLVMAFCSKDVAIAGAKVTGGRIAGLDDPELDRMVKAGLDEMFPPRGINDRDEPPIFGSVEFGAEPRLRLNPLAGILGE